MTAAAATPGAGGLPLGLVCAIVFVVILVLALSAFLLPGRRRGGDEENRLDELHRYRLLGAYSGAPADDSAPARGNAEEHALTTRMLGLLDRALRARGARDSVLGQLEGAGIRMPAERWAAIVVAVAATCGALLALLVGSPLAFAPGGAAGWLACRVFLRVKAGRRRDAFETHLPDALQLLAGALRAGFAVNQSLGAVVREGTEPVASEFGRAMQEVRLGAELTDALDDVALRMRSRDMQLVVMAMRTSREVGGNLAEVLQTTVGTMRERVTLRGQVKVLTAEGRLSAKVLTALPLLMAAYLYAFKRNYISAMYHSGVGIAMLAFGVFLLVAGGFWLHKLTKIEV